MPRAPRNALPAVLACVLLLPGSSSAMDPHGARYLDDADELFWFLQISDTHVGEDLGYGTQDTDNLAWVLAAADGVIHPEFIVNTGDLIDATHGYLVPTGQYQDEWDEYNGVLDGQSVTFFHDIPGNHDTYYDEGASYYLGNSLIGTAYGQWHEAWSHGFTWGEYVFVGLNSADTTGSWAGFDSPGVTEDERAFLAESLEAYADARLAFVFSHHPMWDLEEGADETAGLLEEHGVSAWASGHVHAHSVEQRGTVLHQVLDSAGKGSGENLGLYAVDHDGVSTRALDIGDWPFVMITAPVDAGLGGGNPYAYTVSVNHDANPVRALVFDEEPPLTVALYVDGGEPLTLEEVAPSVWQCAWDATGYGEGEHELSVVAVTPSGTQSHTIQVQLGVTACDDGVDNDGNGYTDHDEDGGCDGPSDDDESGWSPPEDTGVTDTGSGDSAVETGLDPSDSERHTGDTSRVLDSGAHDTGLRLARGCDCSSTARSAWPSLGLLALLLWPVGRRRRG
jgi:hypothetical protein